MQCNEIRNYFADYLAEDLEPSTQEEFSRHLKECRACHAELEVLTDLWVKLGSVSAGEPSSPDLNARLRASAEAYEAEVREAGKGRRVWKRLAVVAAIAAAIAIAVFVPAKVLHRAPATLEDVSGLRRIEFGEVVSSGDVAGRTLVLADSSHVEMRAKSELLLERADDGVRIRLRKGSVLVTAAKQHNGHLYVQTKDVTVSVIGTVFFVTAEEEGSRVAVIEGEVRVKQGTTETSLRRGEQVTTNPKMESNLTARELEWSPEAETQLASLQQATAPFVRVAPTQGSEKFEVASIRFKPRVDGGRGTPGITESCPSLVSRIQIDPHRLSIAGATLSSLVVLAYPEWADTRGGCYGVTNAGILSGGAGWVRSDWWDIQASIPEGPVEYKSETAGVTKGGKVVTNVLDIGPRVRGMLQNLLADRFQLVLRTQTKDTPVYLLTAAKEGFKSNGNPGWALKNGQPVLLNGAQIGLEKLRIIRRITEVDGKSVFLKPEGTAYEEYQSLGIWKMSMPEFAASLNEEMQRPVLDRTNLAGTFDFHLDYTNGTCCMNPARPTIFKALDEVGLKLEASRAPVEVWVIERAEKPSEN